MALRIPRSPFTPVPAPEPERGPEAETQSPPPVYRGGGRLLDWRNTARGGMTVDLAISDAGPYGVHPFKGLLCGRDGGQRMRLLVATPLAIAETGGEAKPVYLGESVLMRWSDDSVSGLAAKFEIDAGPDGSSGQHPFDGMLTGRKEGERLEISAWAVADDETIQHPRETRRKTPFHELSEVKQSQILCRDSRFVSFLAARRGMLPEGVSVAPGPESDPSGFAAAWLYAYLGIQSRAELGYDGVSAERARRRWREVMSDYFREAAGMR